MKAIAITAATGLGLGLCLAAASAPAAAATGAKPKYDPNRVICVNRPVTGSRLERVRVCHTAQEWEEVRVQEKVGLMRKQTNGSAGSGAVPARDSGW